jgi:hypothetical protein
MNDDMARKGQVYYKNVLSGNDAIEKRKGAIQPSDAVKWQGNLNKI